MPIGIPINPGAIDWTGENPGIMLKEREDGPWTALALFFRVVLSPEGRGTALMLYEDPNVARSDDAVHNVVITDNEAMSRYLMRDFVAKFGIFGSCPAFAAMRYLPLTESRPSGDPRGARYTEIVKAKGLDVELIWEELGTPTAMELPPDLSGTKAHVMFSLLVESRKAAIVVNGKTLKGKPVPREQAGLKTTTAFLYFSETWIKPPA